MARRKLHRHHLAETVTGNGHPAFVDPPRKEEVIIVRVTKEEKELLKQAARPLPLSTFIRGRLGLPMGGGR